MNEVGFIEILAPNIFSFNECLSFLDRGFDDCLYDLGEATVSRLVPLDKEPGLLVISFRNSHINVEIHKEFISEEDLKKARLFVCQWFDLERNLNPFYELLNNCQALVHLKSDYYGSRLVGIPDLFEAICWAIIGQQINLKFAYQVKRSLVEKLGESKEIKGQQYYLFPTPEKILSTDRKEFVKMKFSRQKIDYINNVSQAFVDNKINRTLLLACENKEERVDLLSSIKGIGIWTSNYVLMKSIRDLDCITYGDSGLNQALHNILQYEKRPSKEKVDALFSHFSGWESYLNFYLWKSLVK